MNTLQAGDEALCLRDDGYPLLSSGKTYTIKTYEPQYQVPECYGFTFPAYVEVEVKGKSIWCHASRFRKIGE